jgi:hypothetical protein
VAVDVEINYRFHQLPGFFFENCWQDLCHANILIDRGEKRAKVQAKKGVITRPLAAGFMDPGFRVWGGAPDFGHPCFSLELWIFQLEGSKLFEGASEQSAPNL